VHNNVRHSQLLTSKREKYESSYWPEVGFEEISLKRVCELGCDATRGKYDILAKSTRFAQ